MVSLHPARLGILTVVLSAALTVASCTTDFMPGEGPTDAPAGTPAETAGGTAEGTPTSEPMSTVPSSPPSTNAGSPSSTASASPTVITDDELSGDALKTFSETWEDVDYAFDLPSGWAVVDDPSGPAGVSVINSQSVRVASLSILVAWGAECSPDNCVDRPVTYLGDWAGGAPLSKSGPFLVRSVAMDLSAFPREREVNDWPTNVQMVTSLSSNTAAPSQTMVPRYMYGLGQVETDVVASNGVTSRTILFISTRDFNTLQEAQDYAGSDEHRKIQKIIASFREQKN